MRPKIILLALGLAGLFSIINTQASERSYEDRMLRKVIEAYEIQPFTPEINSFEPKEKLGQALFFDPIMGGPKNTACATCHLRHKGSVDGLPMAVGIGSSGVGEQRLETEDAFVIPRNVLPFFNRGAREFTAFFWDGRVQLGPNGELESPLGSLLPEGFDNLLAVAATFPPVEPDEMLGRSLRRGGNKSSTYHAELVSDQVDPDNFQERTLDVYNHLVIRLIGSVENSDSTQIEYRKLFTEAYPGVSDYNITHIGNALSAYISAAFELQPASWDRYIQGIDSALSLEQKQGAMIFYGKGRCAVCHAGTQFSDFQYHGLALPQLGVGKHGGYLDYGRAKATGLAGDRFQFRTPPLRNVTQTGPWGHNGIFDSIENAIMHHFNPIPLLYQAQQERPREAELAGRLLSYRSSTLAEMYPISPEDVGLLVKFLEALKSVPVMSDEQALPESVPSQMNQFILQ
ncbi:His-Xaa-Ser system-associated MauG-like protein [Halopseudomonas pelagia]|uniref:His-Xaa-Ser system-associated MauG-like protein n=1 Tax=Halopseudomonas pelagia TaxID=553151 RepID=UPI0003A6319C|nr:His-Xaa-Ser system-associated MauG-like protein [Halopseudomonas pelagia]